MIGGCDNTRSRTRDNNNNNNLPFSGDCCLISLCGLVTRAFLIWRILCRLFCWFASRTRTSLASIIVVPTEPRRHGELTNWYGRILLCMLNYNTYTCSTFPNGQMHVFIAGAGHAPSWSTAYGHAQKQTVHMNQTAWPGRAGPSTEPVCKTAEQYGWSHV